MRKNIRLRDVLTAIAPLTLSVAFVNCGRVGFDAQNGFDMASNNLASIECGTILLDAYEQTYFPSLSTSCNGCHSGAHGSTDFMTSYNAFAEKGTALINYKATNPHGGNNINLQNQIASITPAWTKAQEDYATCLSTQPLPSTTTTLPPVVTTTTMPPVVTTTTTLPPVTTTTMPPVVTTTTTTTLPPITTTTRPPVVTTTTLPPVTTTTLPPVVTTTTTTTTTTTLPPAPVVTLTQLLSNDPVLGVFRQNCTGCHSAGGAGGLNITNSSQAISNANAILSYMTNSRDPMPPSGMLNAAKIKVVQDWIAGGKKP